jgi:hypothetical protein
MYASQKGTIWPVCLYDILMRKTLLLVLQEEKQYRKVSLSNMGDEVLSVSPDDVTNTGCFGVSCQENWKLCHIPYHSEILITWY